MKQKLKQVITIVLMVSFTSVAAQTHDSLKVDEPAFRGGFGIYPIPNRTMIGYRSNLHKKWGFDSKFGYTSTAIPQLNLELNLLHRHLKNDAFNVYSGFGLTLDGFTPGAIVPLGFELKPLVRHKNIVLTLEASPKFTFSFSSGVYSTFNGNIGIIFFKPKTKK